MSIWSMVNHYQTLILNNICHKQLSHGEEHEEHGSFADITPASQQ